MRVSYHDISAEEIEDAFQACNGVELPCMTRELLYQLRKEHDLYDKKSLTSSKLIRALNKYKDMGLIREEATLYMTERRWSFIGWPDNY